MTGLVVEGLTRHFRSGGGWFAPERVVRAVQDVSFTVAPGEMLGLVGESGCGKSTTAKLILGLMPATAGSMSFDGQPISARLDQAWRQRRAEMQMIYQDPLAALDRRLPAARQIGEPLEIHSPDMSASQRAERVSEIMAQVGLLAHHGARYPHELSGGQRQRVVIARALVVQPKLLVCDEPVSALDVSVQAQVLTLLQDLRDQHRFTSVFISHDLKVVRQIADRVAVMYLGRIVESGTPEQVFHAPQHPYTRALVAASPDPRHKNRDRIVLKGDPPNPADLPPGCAFHTRCPLATEACARLAPRLQPSQGAEVACHLVHPPQTSEAA